MMLLGMADEPAPARVSQGSPVRTGRLGRSALDGHAERPVQGGQEQLHQGEVPSGMHNVASLAACRRVYLCVFEISGMYLRGVSVFR